MKAQKRKTTTQQTSFSGGNAKRVHFKDEDPEEEFSDEEEGAFGELSDNDELSAEEGFMDEEADFDEEEASNQEVNVLFCQL